MRFICRNCLTECYLRVNGDTCAKCSKPIDVPDFFESRNRLVKVNLTREGYEVGRGKYFGVGHPVYRLVSLDGLTPVYELRAQTREAAKEQFRKLFPLVRFHH